MGSLFSFISNAWALMFGWAPSWFGVLCIILIGFLAIIIIIKVIAFILDAIPFL